MALEYINITNMIGNSTSTWILAAVIVLLSFLKWYLGRNDNYWKNKGVPSAPRPGYLYLLYIIATKNMADLIKSLTRTPLGKVYGSFDGNKPNVIVGDPDLLRDILVKDFNVFPYRRIMNVGDPVSDSNVSIVVGEDWKRIRTTITPAFTSKRMRQMGSIINECAKSVIEVCEKHCEKGEPVDCKGMFGAFTMDVIAKSAFGTQINSHNDPQNEFVRKVQESFLSFTIPRFIFSILVPTWLLKLLPASLNPMLLDKDNFFRDVITKIIQKRKETGTRYNDFLQLLMDAAVENARLENQETAEDETDRFGSVSNNDALSAYIKHKNITDTELLAQCVMFFMAGYETTATVLTYVAYCLAINPEWQEKVIKEVDEGFQKHKEMSYDAVREMKILDAVVSETLRMHPPATSTERTAVEDYKLGNTGIVIEKGMRVTIPTLSMHYDPDFFQDPDTFNPERFLDEPKHPQYAYLPFGAGPRNCLGMRFALLEIKMCISNVLRHFRLKPHATTKVPLEYKKGMLLLSVNDLPLSLEKRTDVK
ncbi:cytochrome P450 3A5-like [Argiope bruennichi]|uniref:cytochrome P450 3A5-like n=1 Tax=Argiope bruennichi TaxID=94029 RepID=UPI0024952A7F|nr:cytochrome P450 3A5-like [Argiope bruennichi]